MLSVNIGQAPKSLSVNIKKLVKFKYSSIHAEWTPKSSDQSYMKIHSCIQINIVRKKYSLVLYFVVWNFSCKMGNGNSAALTAAVSLSPQLRRAELLFARPGFGSAFGVYAGGESRSADGAWRKPGGGSTAVPYAGGLYREQSQPPDWKGLARSGRDRTRRPRQEQHARIPLLHSA